MELYQGTHLGKKLLLSALFLLLSGISSLVHAASGYPDYLGGDRDFLLCGGHMGTAYYIDRNSLVIEDDGPIIYNLSIDVITVHNADRKNIGPFETQTRYFRYDKENGKMYEWFDDEWHYILPVGCMAETGHEFSGEMAFYLAYGMKFYGGKQWYSESEKRYKFPNFSDEIYTLIDNAYDEKG